MKILYTSHRYYPAVSGSETYIQKLAEHLYRRGHEVKVMAGDLLDWAEQRRYSPRREIRNGVKIYRIPYSFLSINITNRIMNKVKILGERLSNPYIWGLFQDPLGWKMLIALLNINCDLIHTTPIPRSCVTAAMLAGKIRNIPVVVNPAYHYTLSYYTDYDPLWMGILKKFNLVLTFTEAEAKYLFQKGIPQNKIRIIPPGVDFDKIRMAERGRWRRRLGIPDGQFVVLFICPYLISPEKGFYQVLEAARKLKDIKFIFAGESQGGWEDISLRYNGIENCCYVGFLSEEDKFCLFNDIDLLAMPSIADSYGIVYLEAMSAGKPIIASNIEPMKEVCSGVGLSITYGNVEELVRAIKRLKEDKGLYRDFSDAAIKKAKEHSWSRIAGEVEKVYLELTSL